jgi:hypothetical protein
VGTSYAALAAIWMIPSSIPLLKKSGAPVKRAVSPPRCYCCSVLAWRRERGSGSCAVTGSAFTGVTLFLKLKPADRRSALAMLRD